MMEKKYKKPKCLTGQSLAEFLFATFDNARVMLPGLLSYTLLAQNKRVPREIIFNKMTLLLFLKVFHD